MEDISRFKQYVATIKQHITETDAEMIKQRLDANENFYLIDVRSEADYQTAHLPGAVHLDRGLLELKIEKTVPNTADEIVLYCGGGSRSALSAESLQNMGYSNVKSLRGGFRGWRDAHYETETQ